LINWLTKLVDNWSIQGQENRGENDEDNKMWIESPLLLTIDKKEKKVISYFFTLNDDEDGVSDERIDSLIDWLDLINNNNNNWMIGW